METTLVYWGSMGIMENQMETIYWGSLRKIENKMETASFFKGNEQNISTAEASVVQGAGLSL